VPGKAFGQDIQCLVDPGYTTSVLSASSFRSLPEQVKRSLTTAPSAAQTANGNPVATHGWITLKGRLRRHILMHTFLVADVSEDVILGIDFMTEAGAALDCRAELILGEDHLNCTDGHALITEVTIPTETESSRSRVKLESAPFNPRNLEDYTSNRSSEGMTVNWRSQSQPKIPFRRTVPYIAYKHGRNGRERVKPEGRIKQHVNDPAYYSPPNSNLPLTRRRQSTAIATKPRDEARD
jgi:hypothetical protein